MVMSIIVCGILNLTPRLLTPFKDLKQTVWIKIRQHKPGSFILDLHCPTMRYFSQKYNLDINPGFRYKLFVSFIELYNRLWVNIGCLCCLYPYRLAVFPTVSCYHRLTCTHIQRVWNYYFTNIYYPKLPMQHQITSYFRRI